MSEVLDGEAGVCPHCGSELVPEVMGENVEGASVEIVVDDVCPNSECPGRFTE